VTNCLIVGVGGQGTILASRLIGNAALAIGLDVRGSETIGMAQRGGSVASHLRIGGADSPMIAPGEADLILAFEPCEAARALPYFNPGGLMIACDRAIQPFGPSGYDVREVIRYLRKSVKHIRILDGEAIISRVGARCLNVAMLGAAIACGALPVSMEDIEGIIAARFDARCADMNKRALRFGAGMMKG
jgi:indolepyruvate ferredoxin oxidoreductase beta subunit